MSKPKPPPSSGEETVFSTTSPPIWTSQNAYIQHTPLPTQANMFGQSFSEPRQSVPPMLLSTGSHQFVETTCNSSNVNTTDHPFQGNFSPRHNGPPKFNFCNRFNGPPFYAMNAMPHTRPPILNFNARCNGPLPFPGPNGPPPFNPPFRPNANRPPYQCNFNSRFDKPPAYFDNENISSDRPPFPANVDVRLSMPPPCLENRPYLPPPTNSHSTELFKASVLPHDNYSSNNVRNVTYSNPYPRPQAPLSNSRFIPPPSRVSSDPSYPSTSNSFTALPSFPPPLSSSSPHTHWPHGNQPHGRFATQYSTPQEQRTFSEDNLYKTIANKTAVQVKAPVTFTVPPPNNFEIECEQHSATTKPPKSPALAIPFHPLHPEVISFKKDQDWINKWLEERGKRSTARENLAVTDVCAENKTDTGSDEITKNKTNCSQRNILKLSDVHAQVAKYTALLDELRQCHHPDDDNKAASVKVLLDEMSKQLLDPSYQSVVKRLVGARRKKRFRAKNSRRARLERWQAESKDMDLQRELQSRQYKAEQTQKRLVAEADAVLREVRGKKEDTVSLQLLLGALRDLRQHRLNKGDHQGYVTTQHHTEHFEKVTGSLDEMLESQLEIYEMEERALRAMLDQQRGNDQVPVVTQEDKSDPDAGTTSLAEVLFGHAAPTDPALFASYTAADTSHEMLLARRRAWDKHLVEVGGSGIPVFWVTPPENPSGGWERWIKKA